MDTHTYATYGDMSRKPMPIRELIAQAVEQFGWTHPGSAANVLLLHPVHLAELGTVIEAGGKRWQGSYLEIVDPRTVRVGPVD